MSMVCAQVLYNSILFARRLSLVYSGVVIDGMEPINAVDWRDFSIFRAPSGTVNLTFPVLVDTPVDTFVGWRPAGGDSATVVLSTSPDGVTFTPFATIVVPTDGAIKWTDVTATTVPAGGHLRVAISSASASDWRQISVGARLQFPIGQWVDVNPPRLYQGVVVENVIANNGSIIGRNLRRLEKKGAISLTHLTPAWVRTTWDPFAIHAGRYPFWHRWDPVGHPTEVGFAAAEGIDAPVNAMPPPLMRASMGVRFLT